MGLVIVLVAALPMKEILVMGALMFFPTALPSGATDDVTFV